MAGQKISNLVKDIRVRLGLTQEQFAQKVGVAFSTINQWENGRRNPQPYLFQRLLQIKEETDGKQAKGKK